MWSDFPISKIVIVTLVDAAVTVPIHALLRLGFMVNLLGVL
jgi:hypothetical protein